MRTRTTTAEGRQLGRSLSATISARRGGMFLHSWDLRGHPSAYLSMTRGPWHARAPTCQRHTELRSVGEADRDDPRALRVRKTGSLINAALNARLSPPFHPPSVSPQFPPPPATRDAGATPRAGGDAKPLQRTNGLAGEERRAAEPSRGESPPSPTPIR